jgi:hypothetical protein
MAVKKLETSEKSFLGNGINSELLELRNIIIAETNRWSLSSISSVTAIENTINSTLQETRDSIANQIESLKASLQEIKEQIHYPPLRHQNNEAKKESSCIHRLCNFISSIGKWISQRISSLFRSDDSAT